jgi:23S rRNA pseudouridine1911/1915/1917 synthase
MFDDDAEDDAPTAIPSTLVVPPEAAGARLDRWLAARLDGLSRSRIEGLIAAGHVQVGGRIPTKSGILLKAGDVVEVEVPEAAPIALVPEDLPLNVVYWDEHLAIIDKAPGMVVHPGAGHDRGTLVHGLLAWARARGLPLATGPASRPGIVHRIDKDTSGLMVVALSEIAMNGLQAMFQAHSLERVYRAVTFGLPRGDAGTIRSTHARDPADRRRFTGRTGEGRHAVTHWRVVARGDVLALVECRLETGRTHQIRMHLSEMQVPIVADPLYGRPLPTRIHDARGPNATVELRAAHTMPRLALHAAVLGFRHPVTQVPLAFESPEPADFAALVAAIARP